MVKRRIKGPRMPFLQTPLSSPANRYVLTTVNLSVILKRRQCRTGIRTHEVQPNLGWNGGGTRHTPGVRLPEGVKPGRPGVNYSQSGSHMRRVPDESHLLEAGS